MVLRGSQSLSDSELLAILLRTGTKGKSVIYLAQELLNKYGGLSVIAGKSVESLTHDTGVGKDKAAALAAAFEISRRIDHNQKWYSNKKISSPREIADLFLPLFRDEVKEKFTVICLSSSNKIIKHEVISVGTLNSSIVHPREVFKVAIDNISANIILLHNHPSGNPEPSNEDIQLTKRLVEAGKILEIKVFDHIILAGSSYTSFVERRLI